MNCSDISTGLAGKILNSISAGGFEISALQMVNLLPLVLMQISGNGRCSYEIYQSLK